MADSLSRKQQFLGGCLSKPKQKIITNWPNMAKQKAPFVKVMPIFVEGSFLGVRLRTEY